MKSLIKGYGREKRLGYTGVTYHTVPYSEPLVTLCGVESLKPVFEHS
jgi:hypothetical protein